MVLVGRRADEVATAWAALAAMKAEAEAARRAAKQAVRKLKGEHAALLHARQAQVRVRAPNSAKFQPNFVTTSGKISVWNAETDRSLRVLIHYTTRKRCQI